MSRNAVVGAFSLVCGLCAATGLAETLVVDSSNSPLTLSSVSAATKEYDAMTINGTLNLREKTVIQLPAGATIDLGTTAGVDAVLDIDGDPNTTKINTSSTSSSLLDVRIGAAQNGGSGKIVVHGVRTDVPLDRNYVYNIYTGMGHLTRRYQKLTVLAGAAPNARLSSDSVANDVIDVLELKKGGVVSLASMYNHSKYPARVLFNGGTFAYNNCWEGECFAADTSTRWILESVDGNPIDFHTIWGARDFNSPRNPACHVETRGSGDVRFTASAGAPNYGIFSLRENLKWNHGGNVVVDAYARLITHSNNLLPCGVGRGGLRIVSNTGNTRSYEGSWFNPCGRSHWVNSIEITGNSGWLTNSSSTVSTLTFGTNDLNGTFRVPRLAGMICVKKTGTGTLTITNTPAIPELNVDGGTALVTQAAAGRTTIDSLTIGAAATVKVVAPATFKKVTETVAGGQIVVDGTELTLVTALPPRATLVCVNGGKVVYAASAAAGNTVRLSAADMMRSVSVVKTGEGELQLDAAGGSLASLDVAAGTVRLGAFGTDNRFWRVTYKQAMVKGQNLYMGPLRLFDKTCAFADGGSIPTSASDQTYTDKSSQVSTAASLAANQFICSSSNYQANSDASGACHRDPYCMFWCSTVFSCCFNFAPALDKPETWVTMTWRIPDAATVGYPSAYDLKSQWEGTGKNRPGAWKLESSPTGEDGTWETMDEKSGIVGSWGQSWYNGQNSGADKSARPWELPAAIRDSATPLASIGSLKVAAGAVFDATLVTGGQEIGSLTVDAAGGGTLKNVSFAAAGVLDIVNVSGKLPANFKVPLVFETVGATANLGGWTVRVNGAPAKGWPSWQDGQLCVVQPGCAIILK